jgi:hypothetical protein
MKSHRPTATDEQIEQHSLPGINMAGKTAPEDTCEPGDERERRQPAPDPAGREPATAPDSDAD